MKYRFLIWVVLFSAFARAQQVEYIDFKHIQAQLQFDTVAKQVSGNLIVDFQVLSPVDSVFLDAKNMTQYTAFLGKDTLKSTFDGKHWSLYSKFKPNRSYTVKLHYTAQPTKALYFVNNLGKTQIWTQGQGKYTSNWLPSIDDMNDKIEFDLSIVAPNNKQVIANGKLIDKVVSDTTTLWKFDMQHPMASYLVALAIGDYDKKELTAASGIPIDLYYYPEDSLQVEPTYRYSQQIFDFLETEIGVAYPWQDYKQVPVKDFLYAGMENTTTTLFSDHFMVDDIGFVDQNYVNVNAHELAHQWFGDLVTETSGTHHWLQEGFATFYALLAEKEIFGDDYYYWQLYQSAEQLKALSDEGKGEKLINDKASSLTFYQKGAWALHILREEIGEQAFKEAVKNYLNAYQFKNVSTQDFLAKAKEASGKDLVDFEDNWIKQSAFIAKEALQSLQKSSFIERYLAISALRKLPLAQKQDALLEALKLPNNYIGQEVVYQLAGESMDLALPVYEKAFVSNNHFVRQAIAVSLQQIPTTLQPAYESLLEDQSYVTQEMALLNLWSEIPQKRIVYLEKLKGIAGFSDKNVETLWLALSLATSTYDPDSWEARYETLIDYTNPEYAFSIRENAFRYLYQLQLYEPQSLTNLVAGCLHANWRFTQSCRSILDALLADEKWKNRLQELTDLDQKEQEFLKTKIE